MTAVHTTARRPIDLDDVPGWFPPLDRLLFTWFLERQARQEVRGDLLELGAYMGKSAVLLGHHLDSAEKFTVCDLFEGDAPDEANRAEATKSYASLTRQAFEENYLSFHDELPKVVQAPSSVISAEVDPGSCRFVHIDASHLYEHVYGDIGAARELLGPGGIVVLDDFRSEHTPGVSVAAWEAVLNRGLRPLCLSTQKMYATWEDPEPLQDELLDMLRERDDIALSVQQAAGHRLVRVKSKAVKAPDSPRSRHHAEVTEEPKAAAARQPVPVRRRSLARRIAVDLTPPVVTRAVRRARRA